MSVQLHVNSRNRLYGTNTDFAIAIQTTEKNVKSMSLISFSMQNLSTNINIYNNTICYYYSGSNHILMVPVGQYTASQLVTALNLLDNRVTWSLINNAFVANTSIAASIIYRLSSLLEVMGGSADIVLPLSASTSLPLSPDLSGCSEIFVCCSAAVSSCLTQSKRIPLVSLIHTDAEYGAQIHYKPTQMSQQEIPINQHVPAQLQTLFFQLLDNRGNILIVPQNCYCSMLFKLNF